MSVCLAWASPSSLPLPLDTHTDRLTVSYRVVRVRMSAGVGVIVSLNARYNRILPVAEEGEEDRAVRGWPLVPPLFHAICLYTHSLLFSQRSL